MVDILYDQYIDRFPLYLWDFSTDMCEENNIDDVDVDVDDDDVLNN